jgi:hypothetical protein
MAESRADRLLREERDAPLPSGLEQAKARVEKRLRVTLAVGAAARGPSSPPSPPSPPVGQNVVRTAGAVLAALAIFAAGIVVGRISAPVRVAAPSSIDATRRDDTDSDSDTLSRAPAPHDAPRNAPAPPEEQRAEVPNTPHARAVSPAPSASARPVPSAPPKALPSEGTSARSDDALLATERALIDRARVALKAGRPNDALVAIGEHRALFAKGGAPRLAEERDAFEVHALARSGRAEEAKVAAARFHATYPSSLFGASVDDAISR